MRSRMDAPHLDPSRGRRAAAGLFARGVRLLGLVMFVTGLLLACHAGFQWLQTGHADPTLVEDVMLPKLPDQAQAWIAHPRSWYGLHRFTRWVLQIPLFASIAFTGFLILLTTAASDRT